MNGRQLLLTIQRVVPEFSFDHTGGGDEILTVVLGRFGTWLCMAILARPADAELVGRAFSVLNGLAADDDPAVVEAVQTGALEQLLDDDVAYATARELLSDRGRCLLYEIQGQLRMDTPIPRHRADSSVVDPAPHPDDLEE